jgi:hypothetical protein
MHLVELAYLRKHKRVGMLIHGGANGSTKVVLEHATVIWRLIGHSANGANAESLWPDLATKRGNGRCEIEQEGRW